jgi:hypothetical protein
MYKGYCYATQGEAVKADISNGSLAGSAGVSSPTAYTVVNSTTVNMTYSYKPYSTTAAANYVHTRVYPTCTEVGYLTNYSGMNITDVVTTSWLVVGVWVAAFTYKAFRQAARGY